MSVQGAPQTTTTHCFRCQRHPGPDGEPLKRCGRCRARHYCSTECQRNDWANHKNECSILAAGGQAPTRERTTMRLNWPLTGARPDPDVIYYLKTTKPHVQDVSISGPFYPLSDVELQLRNRMTMERSTGGPTLDDLILSGGLPSMEHFNAPCLVDTS